MAAKKKPRKGQTTADPLQMIGAFVSRTDVLGLSFMLVAILTLLSLVTSSKGVITGAWIGWLETLFGVGVWLLPLVTGALGLWMVVRAFEGMPELSWKRPAGAVMLFLAAIVGATLWMRPGQPEAGGIVGLLLADALEAIFGVIFAWAFVTFMVIFGTVLLTDRFLIDWGLSLGQSLKNWQELVEVRRHSAPIDPAWPLPMGIPTWWRPTIIRLRAFVTNWRQPPLSEPISNMVSAKPEAQPAQRTRTEPQRAPQSIATAPTRPQTTLAPGETSLLTPTHVIGGGQEWRLPRLDEMLKDWERHGDSDNRIREQGRLIQETLELFGVPADFEGAYKGPSVTQYLIKPGYIERTVSGEVKRIKIKVSKIAVLANDLALALAAPNVRIEAPIPGTNYVGVEVPNQDKNTVGLKELMESDTFQQMKGRLRIALGEDVKGQSIISDLARMPHLLIAGATGSGKSACINSIICCLTLTHTPDTLRLLMVDPKMVELSTYNGIPHLLSPVVTEVDKAAGVLYWAVKEMERRYTIFSKVGSRDLVRYNEYLTKRGEKILPYIVVVVDEMADLMMAAPEDVEKHICRLAQMARAVGIHLIIATQRPSVDVITGLIKANFPARIAFAVTSQTDSRVILDIPGAERLLGRGDMLFMAPDSSKLERLQGTYVTDDEINRIVRHWKGFRTLEDRASGQWSAGQEGVGETPLPEMAPTPDKMAQAEQRGVGNNRRSRSSSATASVQSGRLSTPPATLPATGLSQPPLFDDIAAMKMVDGRDELFDEAVRAVSEAGRGSVSLLQRKLRIGYSRASRLVDQLEDAGILGPDQNNGAGRDLLIETAMSQRAQPGPSLSAPPQPRIFGMEDDDDGAPIEPRVWM